MKNIIPFVIFTLLFLGCKDDDIEIFEKSADERASDAINNLKQDLIAPTQGWRLKYTPVSGYGSYFVLLKFEDDNTVNIKSDLGANDGEFFDQTITYRIDNSLGLELIFESYSFFSFLFEQDQATFEAEYEFDFVNKTPDDALVFQSKTDVASTKTIITLEPASAADVSLLGQTLASNLHTISDDIGNLVPSYILSYPTKGIEFYISLDELKRTISFSQVASISNPLNAQTINATSSYTIQGNNLVLGNPLSGTVLGISMTIESFTLTDLDNGTLDLCNEARPVEILKGVSSLNEPITLKATLSDLRGKDFISTSDFYVAPMNNIIDDGRFIGSQVQTDIAGATYMQLYYGAGSSGSFNALGFYIPNSDGTATFILQEFIPTISGNKVTFELGEIFVEGTASETSINNTREYVRQLTEGGQTYVFKLNDDAYEFHNPCTGLSVVFLNAN